MICLCTYLFDVFLILIVAKESFKLQVRNKMIAYRALKMSESHNFL